MSESDRETRPERIREALAALRPEALEITDDSHRHRNHAGAADGRGHFRVRVVSKQFEGLNRIQRHQLVFSTVGDLMVSDIHALQIDAKTPEEAV